MVQKKENLRRMLEGQLHEHIPVSFFQHLKPEELHGEACVKAHIRFYKQTDPDFLKIMHDGLTAPVDLGLTSLEELKAYRPIKGRNPWRMKQIPTVIFFLPSHFSEGLGMTDCWGF